MKRLRNSFKALLGFTLAEVVIVMLVVAVIVAATIGVTKHKLDNITTYTYYSAYSTLRVATSQMLSDYDPNNEIFQAKIETPDLLAKVGTFFANNFGVLAANAYTVGGFNPVGGGNSEYDTTTDAGVQECNLNNIGSLGNIVTSNISQYPPSAGYVWCLNGGKQMRAERKCSGGAEGDGVVSNVCSNQCHCPGGWGYSYRLQACVSCAKVPTGGGGSGSVVEMTQCPAGTTAATDFNAPCKLGDSNAFYVSSSETSMAHGLMGQKLCCCPKGQKWNGSACYGTKKCTGNPPTKCSTCKNGNWIKPICMFGQTLDETTCTCVTKPSEPECNIVCRAGQTLDKENCKCITNAGDGASKPECTGGKVWNGVACVCPAGKEEVNGQCVSPCTGGKVRNSSGLCVCPSGTETVNGKCVAPCTGGKVRNSSGVCVCPSGKEDVNGTCMSPCPNGKVRNSSGTCVCPSGKEEYNGRCVDPCTGGKVRNPLGGCVCPSGTTEILGRCLAPAVSQPTTPTCSGGKVWNGSACVCPSGKEEYNGSCVSPCTNGKVRGSSGNCECPINTEDVNGSCKPKCTGGKVRNFLGLCVCPSGTEEKNGVCVAPPAVSIPTCTGGKEWNGSACVCPSGTEDVFGTCKPKCSGGKVRNSSGICVCPSGKIEQDGICVAESIYCFGGREWNGSECVCPEGKEWTGLYCRDIPRVYDCTGTAPCGKQCDTSTGNWINIPGFSRECDPEQNKVWSESQCACVPSSRTIAPKGQNYCEYMVGLLNTKSNAPECTGNAISTNALDFSDKLPDITLRNGMRLFNVRQNPQMIPALANNVEGGKVTLNGVEVDTNRWGYTVYVDIDGEKGNSEKWVDVFPFYVTLSGMVIPAYDEDNPGVYGGDNRNFLQVSIEDEVIDNGRRKTKWLAKSVSYKEAACGSGYIGANTPYCKNGNAVPIKNECTSDSSLCRLKYIKPIKFLF